MTAENKLAAISRLLLTSSDSVSKAATDDSSPEPGPPAEQQPQESACVRDEEKFPDADAGVAGPDYAGISKMFADAEAAAMERAAPPDYMSRHAPADMSRPTDQPPQP